MQTHGTRGQVEGAVPAAEVAAGGRAVAGILGHRVGAYLERRRPGARPGRGGKRGRAETTSPSRRSLMVRLAGVKGPEPRR